MADKRAQFTLRGDTAHFQYGVEGSYEKYDVPATADLKAFYVNAVEEGDTMNSLASTSTQYATVSVKPAKVAFEMVLSKVIRVEV